MAVSSEVAAAGEWETEGGGAGVDHAQSEARDAAPRKMTAKQQRRAAAAKGRASIRKEEERHNQEERAAAPSPRTPEPAQRRRLRAVASMTLQGGDVPEDLAGLRRAHVELQARGLPLMLIVPLVFVKLTPVVFAFIRLLSDQKRPHFHASAAKWENYTVSCAKELWRKWDVAFHHEHDPVLAQWSRLYNQTRGLGPRLLQPGGSFFSHMERFFSATSLLQKISKLNSETRTSGVLELRSLWGKVFDLNTYVGSWALRATLYALHAEHMVSGTLLALPDTWDNYCYADVRDVHTDSPELLLPVQVCLAQGVYGYLREHGVDAAKEDPVGWLEEHEPGLLEVKERLSASCGGLVPPPKVVVVDYTRLLKERA